MTTLPKAAAIANGIAVAFTEQRRAHRKELAFKTMKALQAEVPKLGIEIEALEESVNQLGAKLNLPTDSLQPPGLAKNDSRSEFYKQRRELENLRVVRKGVMARLHEEKIDPLMINDPPVEIIDEAEPDFRPVKPHPLLKILVPLAGLLAGVLGIVLLMLAVMMKTAAKKSPPPLP